VKFILLLFLLIPLSAKACSPPLDGRDFTCPPHDFMLPSPAKNQPVKERIYKNNFGWQAQAVIKKLKNYELEQSIKSIDEMISKALVNYKKI
tara:strand:+ start:205 stop:480 length:276 start_codon:yes stop_codon:yes gene_type:complete